MKKYELSNNMIKESKENANVIFINIDNKDELEMVHEYNEHIHTEIKSSRGSVTLDFYKEYYYGNLILETGLVAQTTNLFYIVNDDVVYFMHHNNFKTDEFLKFLNSELNKYLTIYNEPLFLILLIINQLIKFEVHRANRLLSDIDKIENSLISEKEMASYNLKILEIRKTLTRFRKRAAHINEVIDTLQAEQQSFIELTQYVDLIDNRAARLTHDIQNMIEHTLQIKEVYQNQLDINLNNTMNVFTVISAVFLPLNLMVGWFGMNFHNMPELSWKYGYIMVIIISIIIVAGVLYTIKKYNFLNIKKK